MQTKLPIISNDSASKSSQRTVRLNGYKVLFDKKVTLMPVELKIVKDENTVGQS